MNESEKHYTVCCIFERDEDNLEKSNLIAIYEDPQDALEHIELDNNLDLFWENWKVMKRRKP